MSDKHQDGVKQVSEMDRVRLNCDLSRNWTPSNKNLNSCPLVFLDPQKSGILGGSSMMRSGRTTRDPVLLSPTSAPTLLEWPCQEQRGSGLTTSAPACTNGVWPLSGLWVWRRRTNRRPCCRPIHQGLHGLTVLDDNRMATQQLPCDVMRPSSG